MRFHSDVSSRIALPASTRTRRTTVHVLSSISNIVPDGVTFPLTAQRNFNRIFGSKVGSFFSFAELEPLAFISPII